MINGWMTIKIQNLFGFKGLSFIIGTVGMLNGKIDSSDWTLLAMTISGLKVTEDYFRRNEH